MCSAALRSDSTASLQVDAAAQMPFKKILCANRGEIAVRVFRAGTELGLRTVCGYNPVQSNMLTAQRTAPCMPH